MKLHTSALVRPARFELPHLIESRPTTGLDDHAQELAVALHNAREEGLRQARVEIDAAVESYEAARRELSRAAQVLLDAAAQLTSRDRDDLSDIEGQAVLFGLELAEHLIGRELSSCDDQFVAAMERAVQLIPDRGAITLRVNPLDVEMARSSLVADSELHLRIEVAGDPSVERGGCIAVVGSLRIDAQMGPAMDRVRATIHAEVAPLQRDACIPDQRGTVSDMSDVSDTVTR